ncbi:MAG: RDD family protein [Bacilli bacterium]|nr:RDD family protein [Bacilli bacterium]
MGNNTIFWKRFLAFIIDSIIISFVCTLIVMPFLDSNKINKLSDNTKSIVEDFSNNKISIEEYTDQLNNIEYQLSKEMGLYSLLMLVVGISYYGIYQYKTSKTLGKKLMHIKLDSNNGELTLNQVLFRCLIINCLIFSFIELVFLVFANSSIYLVASSTLHMIYYFILISSFFMITFRKDKRGLHDVICNTKVVNCDK